VFLVVSYLRRVVGPRFALVEAGGAAVHLSGSVLVRVLSPRLHRARGDNRLHCNPVHSDANDGADPMDRAVPAPGSAASLSAAGSMSYSGLAGRRNGSSTCTCWWDGRQTLFRGATALTETIEGVDPTDRSARRRHGASRTVLRRLRPRGTGLPRDLDASEKPAR